jgi:hypothetical protein
MRFEDSTFSCRKTKSQLSYDRISIFSEPICLRHVRMGSPAVIGLDEAGIGHGFYRDVPLKKTSVFYAGYIA